jgi:hypothetical protein
MPKIRKTNTTQRKKTRKLAQEALKQKTSMLLDMPEKCCVCNDAFDKKSRLMAQTWHVVVFESKKIVRLSCPACWEKIETEVGEPNAT